MSNKHLSKLMRINTILTPKASKRKTSYLNIKEHWTIWHRPRKINAWRLPFINCHAILKCTFVKAVRREFRKGRMHSVLYLEFNSTRQKMSSVQHIEPAYVQKQNQFRYNENWENRGYNPERLVICPQKSMSSLALARIN